MNRSASTRPAVVTLAALIALSSIGLALLSSISAASDVRLSAVDVIDRTLEIPITSARGKVTLPASLLFTSATLDSREPGNTEVNAPKGHIFLYLRMTAGPAQSKFGSTAWGHFFSNMAPLPATALRYVSSSGHPYRATRVDPIPQADNPNASTDNGIVDATYYFTVPISNRTGTVVIERSQTLGVEYHGFVGGPPEPLLIGGPTRIPIHFPRQLTIVTTPVHHPASAPNRHRQDALAGITLATLLVVGFGLERRRARGRSRDGSAPPIPSPPANPSSHPPLPSPATNPVGPRSEPRETIIAPGPNGEPAILRIDVLGPVRITPTAAKPSEPVRAILAFLALNSERPLTLEEIQTTVWLLTDSGIDIGRPAMRNYMVEARKVVGEAHLPSASGRRGYQLHDFSTDWGEFQVLIKESDGKTKADATDLRRRALSLVKGPPFAGDTSRYFSWAHSASVVYRIVDAVTLAARSLGTDLVLACDLPGAEHALRLGLLADPASLTLWEALTDVLLETADESLLALHWKAAALVLRPTDVTALRARKDG